MIKLIAPRNMVIVATNVKQGSLSQSVDGINEGTIVDADEKTGLKVGQSIFFGKNYATIPVTPNEFIHLTMQDSNVYAAWETNIEGDNVIKFKKD